MTRLSTMLFFLLVSTLVSAQETGIAPDPQSPASAGTQGDTWLILGILIATVAVAIGVYLFIRRGGRVRM